MADFEGYSPKDPAAVDGLVVTLKWTAADGYSASYHVRLVDEDGNQVHAPNDTGNLIPYMTAGQVTQAQDFVDAMKAKAQGLVP
ncbi:hypothetical protein ACFLWA_12625 [Chloroflexota bacterium]